MATTYGVREFKARVSEILHDLDAGDEVIITRNGKPCARLTRPEASPVKPSRDALHALRELGKRLPDATWEDFQEIKKIWEPRIPDDL